MKDLCKTNGSKSVGYPNRFHSRELIDYVFNELWNAPVWDAKLFADIQNGSSFPKVNVKDTGNSYSIEIAVAGYSKEEVELELKENVLYMRGESKTVEEEGKFLAREISYRSFKRALKFPDKINSDTATCSYKDGIINVKVDKLNSISGSTKLTIN
jgi:HSP20 family protein